MSALYLVIFLCGCHFPTHGVLLLRQVTPDDYPGAVCNDGTPATFYHSMGVPTNRNFLIYLEGGFFCSDIEACEERCITYPYYCSWAREPTIDPTGIFSEDQEKNPVFASFYKLFVHYCTSDMYVGESGPSESNGGFYFKGRAHITAVVNSLRSMVGLTSGDHLVVSGNSAGGRGVLFNCEYIASLLPDVDVRCVVGAAIFYPKWDTNPFFEDCKPFSDLVMEAVQFWNGTIVPFDVNNWWENFSLPVFIGIQQFDAYAFLYYCVDKYNDEHMQKWAEGMKEVSLSLIRKAPHIGLFVPGCHGHPLLKKDRYFYNVQASEKQLSYVDVLGNWFTGDGPIHAWDDCTSDPANCNHMCDPKDKSYPLM